MSKRLSASEREKARSEHAEMIEREAVEKAERRGERFLILNKPRRVFVPDMAAPWAIFNRQDERAHRRSMRKRGRGFTQ